MHVAERHESLDESPPEDLLTTISPETVRVRAFVRAALACRVRACPDSATPSAASSRGVTPPRVSTDR